MEWKKPSKELADLLAKAIEPADCQKKTMFGAPVYTVNGNMFTGVHEDHLFLRLSEADRKGLAAHFKEAKPFEPVKGRIMKEYMVAPPAVYTNREILQQWLKKSYGFAESLPVKKTKPRSR
jgi:TfoX/Sxy family transcriptional regulator of competence genes